MFTLYNAQLPEVLFGKESPIVLKRDKNQQLRNNCELKGLCDTRYLGNI